MEVNEPGSLPAKVNELKRKRSGTKCCVPFSELQKKLQVCGYHPRGMFTIMSPIMSDIFFFAI